jgi:TonB family protein
MHRRPIGVLIAIGLSLLSASRAGAELLRAVKPWVLDYAETQCVASRDFGSAVFAIRPAPNGETFEILVFEQHPGPYYPVEFKGTVDFGGGPISVLGLVSPITSNGTTLYQIRVSAVEIKQALSASGVTISSKSQRFDRSFALDNMSQLMTGLDQCTADLQSHWNMTVSGQARMATRVKGSFESLFTPEEYPRNVRYRPRRSDGKFLLLVNERGRVEGCHVMESTGIPAVDTAACSIYMRRAKFSPARDREGKPMRDTIVTPPINWGY